MTIIRDNVQALVCVRLTVPLENPEGGPPAVGYYRWFWATSSPEELRALIEDEVTDGEVDWDATEVNRADVDGLDPDVVVPEPHELAIWHRSGCAFFALEE